MGVLIGLIVGYVMGTKAGANELEELKGAWKAIRSSDEAHDMMAGGLSMARSLLSKGGGLLAERLQAQGNDGGSAWSTVLRPTG